MQYSVSVNNIQGYETVQQNHCQGQIKDKEIKTCLTTIYDSTKPLSIPSSQPIGGADQSATAQPPSSSQSIGGADQSTTAQPPAPLPPPQTEGGGAEGGTGGGSGNLLPSTPFNFTANGDFRDNTNTDENMAANNPEVVLILGDFSYNGNAAQWWSKNMDALNSLNVIGALGNHDEPNDDFLNLWPLNGGKWEFIKKIGNVAFDTENNDHQLFIHY